jgi:hypothetical protein
MCQFCCEMLRMQPHSNMLQTLKRNSTEVQKSCDSVKTDCVVFIVFAIFQITFDVLSAKKMYRSKLKLFENTVTA